MKLLSPLWLGWLLVLPIVFGLLVLDERRRRAAFARFALPPLWASLAPELDFKARLRKALLWTAAMAFGILALARPQWGSREEVLQVTGLDVIFVLDVSNSMEAEDVLPSRLLKARHEIRGLLDRLQGDRVGLVAFAGNGYLACPLTTDLEYLYETAKLQSPRLVPTQGTDISVGLQAADRALDRGAETSGPSGGGAEAQPTRVVVLLTDGEDHEGGAEAAAARLKAEGVRLYVIGVGTEKGAPVPVRDETGQIIAYKKTRKGETVVSRLQPEGLARLAADGGGRYWTATPGEVELSELIGDLGGLKPGQLAERRYLVYQERFQYPLFIAVLLLLLELGLRPARRGASAGTRGSGGAAAAAPALAAVLWLLGGLLGPAPARAADLGPPEIIPKNTKRADSSAPWMGTLTGNAGGMDAYLENKKGVEAYRAGKVDEARQHFGEAQALEPDRPELQYNQGLVHLRENKPDEAIHEFKGAARGAIKRGDVGLLGKSFFNLGEALAKKGDTDAAIRSYLGAIGAARKAGDPALDRDARKNLELLAKKQEEQKQQQQQQGQQQQQASQDKDGKGNSQEQQPSEAGKPQQGEGKDQNKSQENQPQRYSDGQQQEKNFSSRKLSPDDAERVMQEIRNNEQSLQARRQRQQNGYGTRAETDNVKDW